MLSDIIIVRDLNGHVGCHPVPGVTGQLGIGCKNREGDNPADFPLRNNLALMSTYFKHNNSRMYRVTHGTGTIVLFNIMTK